MGKLEEERLLVILAPGNPQVTVAKSFWILYNLERNEHFHKPYYFCSLDT